jgi:hypothetical protein
LINTNPLKPGGELGCPVRVGSSCPPSSISHVTLAWLLNDFLESGWLLTRKPLNQGFLVVKLKSSLRKFKGRHHDLVNRTEYLWNKWPHICSVESHCYHQEMFIEDTDKLITNPTRTMIYKILHRKPKIDQHKPPKARGWTWMPRKGRQFLPP